MLRDVLARAEMGQGEAEWRRPAMANRGRSTRTRGMSRDELLPHPADAPICRVVDVNPALLIEPKQRRFLVVSDALKRRIDRGKAIAEPISIRKPRMSQ